MHELLTVLCTDTAISTGRDSRVSGRLEGNSGKRIQLVLSVKYENASKFVSYLRHLKSRLYHVRDARQRDLEIPGGLTLNECNHYIINQCPRCFKTQ